MSVWNDRQGFMIGYSSRGKRPTMVFEDIKDEYRDLHLIENERPPPRWTGWKRFLNA